MICVLDTLRYGISGVKWTIFRMISYKNDNNCYNKNVRFKKSRQLWAKCMIYKIPRFESLFLIKCVIFNKNSENFKRPYVNTSWYLWH